MYLHDSLFLHAQKCVNEYQQLPLARSQVMIEVNGVFSLHRLCQKQVLSTRMPK